MQYAGIVQVFKQFLRTAAVQMHICVCWKCNTANLGLLNPFAGADWCGMSQRGTICHCLVPVSKKYMCAPVAGCKRHGLFKGYTVLTTSTGACTIWHKNDEFESATRHACSPGGSSCNVAVRAAHSFSKGHLSMHAVFMSRDESHASA